MIKRELKLNLKSFIIWTTILVGMFLVVFLIYPSIVNSKNIGMMDEMMNIFPKEVLKAFNMDISSIDNVFGWLKSEGFVFILLITGAYSAILGSNILLKEENDKTIEYLNSLPITRTKIVVSKMLVGIIYVLLMVLILGVFNYIGLSLSGDFDKKTYILLSVTPIFSSVAIYSLCLFISTFFSKTRKTLGISLGIVFISYFLQIISELSDSTEFLKYLSIFTLADIRNVIIKASINPVILVISIIFPVVFILLTIVRYNRKELI